MNINKHITDQRIRKLVEDYPDWFEETGDYNKKLSKAFLLLGVSSFLEIDYEQTYNCITEGADDAGIDAVYIGDTNDSEFTVYLFQSKYVFDLEKDSNFPANSILRVLNSIATIFDARKETKFNLILKTKINEIQSLAFDYIPIVKVIFLNNGLIWNEEGDNHIQNSNFPEDQVSFEHFNHEGIVKHLRATRQINDSITLDGKAIIEDFDYKRVLIGKVNVTEIGNLMIKHEDFLLEKNIRKFLGWNKNRVNNNIKNTLLDDQKRKNFYFFNNGITIICKKFSYNALISDNWQLKIEDIQIVNGGQTSKTIVETIIENPDKDFSQAKVMLRLYEVSEEDKDSLNLTTDITIATNSQTPVDLRDLRANDSLQRNLELAVKELGYTYIVKKGTIVNPFRDYIPSSVAAEAIFTIWKQRPHLAKYKRSELFGKFYDDVFQNINGAQLILATLIHRFCDVNRKKNVFLQENKHLPYSNYYLSMICGQILLAENNLELKNLTHKNFNEIVNKWNVDKMKIYSDSIKKLNFALEKFFPNGINEIDPRRLAATFRRGDLLSILEN